MIDSNMKSSIELWFESCSKRNIPGVVILTNKKTSKVEIEVEYPSKYDREAKNHLQEVIEIYRKHIIQDWEISGKIFKNIESKDAQLIAKEIYDCMLELIQNTDS